ncbi:uncharacterized protein LOC142225039 [Haematobia irritans]|uniref:uncharacterized protein LOC142225039 n=1 Tax=Haematobia irritans TaxID=7368 RepID=UPI003F4F904E
MASPSGTVPLCAQCGLTIKEKHMICGECGQHFHFSPCCSLQQSSYAGMNAVKKAAWKCHKCRERKPSNTAYQIVISSSENSAQKQKRCEEDDNDDDVFDESNKRQKNNSTNPIKNNPIFQIQSPITQKQTTSEEHGGMQMMMQNIAAQLSSINAQLQNQQTTLTHINENLVNLNTQVTELQLQNKEKDKKLLEMEMTINKLEQKLIRKNIEISNIKNETLSAGEIIEKIATKINIVINENDIENIEGNGGGIAIYVKESITYNIIRENTITFESLRINVFINKIQLSLLAIYRPPRTSRNQFIEELEQCICKVKRNDALFIVGDVNINILSDRDKTTSTYLDIMSSYGLQCLVNEITREDFNTNRGSCIDHMFVRSTRAISSGQAVVVMSSISDHFSLFCCMSVNDTQNQKRKNNYNGINQGSATNQHNDLMINTRKVNNLCRNVNWNEINTNDSCDETFKKILDKFNKIYAKSMQTKPTLKKRNEFPWLNNQILYYCKLKDKLYQRYRKNRNNTEKEREYKLFNNKLNKIIQCAKNEYYRNEFIKNRNNIRGTWKTLNVILGKKVLSLDQEIKRNFKNDNLRVVTENFAIKFDENVKTILHDCNIKTFTYQETRIHNSIYFEETNELEILNILKTLNLKKGPGVDGIRPKDVRNNAEQLVSIITTFVNSSLNECKIPQLLKTSLVRPIYKKGQKDDYNNYRPISILPVLEKVLEEIIVRRLNNFLSKYNIINDNQYGFQKGKNINKLLGHFSNFVNQKLDQRAHCIALFIDFSKAFDSLSHGKLLSTLERNGIRGQCLQWFKNYLECRSFRVQIDDNVSKQIPIKYGVPQGSKLGPVLYLIYANELLNILKNSKAFAYADDTAVIVSHPNLEDAQIIMQTELNNIARWCHDNGLIINADKTKLLHIRLPSLSNTSIKLKFHSTQCLHSYRNSADNDSCETFIEVVDEIKYLGVVVDKYFNWKSHIQELNKKLRKALYILYHLNNSAPLAVTKQAYFALVESQLRHGITSFGSSSHCKILQLTQNRLLKMLMKNRTNDHNIITNNNDDISQQITNPRQNVTIFAQQHSILSVSNLYKNTILNEFHGDSILKPISHIHNTRRRVEGRFYVPQHNNKYGKRSLNVQLPMIFNSMPLEALNSGNRHKRKKLIKRQLLLSQ